MTLPGHRYRASVQRTAGGRFVLTLTAHDARSGASAEFATQSEALDAIPSLLRELTGNEPPVRPNEPFGRGASDCLNRTEAVDGPRGRYTESHA